MKWTGTSVLDIHPAAFSRPLGKFEEGPTLGKT